MRRLFSSLLSLAASTVFAQNVTIEVDPDLIPMPGVELKVKHRQHREAPPPGVAGIENFSIEYSPMGVPAQTIKVLHPEGALAQVWNEQGLLEGSYEVPFNFRGRGNTYYRFIINGPAGELFYDRKLEVKQYLGGTLRMARGPMVRPPPPMPAQGMPPGDFAALLAAVEEAGFSDEKTGVVSTAASSHLFTVEQVGALVDVMAHSSDKVKVVEILRGRIVDRQNNFRLLEHFSFSSDKAKVQGLIR